MTEFEDGSSILDSWSDDPLAAGVAAALGAAAGAAIAFAYTSSLEGGGDEPPIRVRHGSMRIQLLQAKLTRKFVQVGNPKKWTIDGNADRGKDEYLVVILPDDPTKIVVKFASDVVILYSDGKWVHFKSTGRKTRVTSEKDLSLQTDQELKYNGSGGYIAKVEVNGNSVYESGAVDTALQVVLLDV
jgi:hypothetical protein